MDGFSRILMVLTPGRIIALVVSLAIVGAIFSFLMQRMETANMALLYGGLTPEESAQIASHLDTLGVNYQVKGDSAIFVPSSRVGELRLNTAGAGLVGSSNAGYEIFDKGSSFGTTSLVQNINAKRALEGELSRTISSLPAVKGARVHLVMPKRQVFSRQHVKPTAGVSIDLGGRVLTEEQVDSIAQLVAAAVPSLQVADVTVIDQRGNLLSAGKGGEARIVSSQAKVKAQVERNLENRLTEMLEKVVGSGKASVQVSADMDFNRIEESIETFDPDQQVVRSEQTTATTSNASSGAGGEAGVTANLPGGGAGGAGGSSENNTREEATVNYEIGKTVKHVTHQGGKVERLSVAVLVEGNSGGSEAGGYTPMDATELGKLEALVKTAIGFDQTRGDSVEITDMAFSTPPEVEAVEPPMFTKNDYMRFVEYGGGIAVILLIALLVLRPMFKAFGSVDMSNMASSAVSAAHGGMAPQRGGARAGGAPAMGGGGDDFDDEPSVDATIDMKQVKGRVKESKVKKVAEIVDAYPEESLSVVRGWMASDNRSS